MSKPRFSPGASGAPMPVGKANMPTFEAYAAAVFTSLRNTHTRRSVLEAHEDVLAEMRPDLHAAVPAHARESLERFLRWVLDNWY